MGDNNHGDNLSTFDQAMSDKDFAKWMDTIQSKIDSMHMNQVWIFKDPLKGIAPIRYKLVNKRKIGSSGEVQTYNIRLILKGHNQKEEIDYKETFSPTVMFKTIHILLVIVVHLDYEIWHVDVKTTFLNGFLEEDIYVVQSHSFEVQGQSHKGCKLNRSIYELKQASRRLNLHYDGIIKLFGFIKNEDKTCI